MSCDVKIDHLAKIQQKVSWPEVLSSGNRVFVGSNAAVPSALMDDLIANPGELFDIELVHILTLSETPWANRENSALFKVNSLFLGPGVRDAVGHGYADYTPCFLSEIPSLFQENILPLDVALIMVSPPDEFGYCSFGVSVDIVSSAVKSAKKVIAQINPKMPRTCGHSFIHIDEIDCAVLFEAPLPCIAIPELDKVTEQIGQYVSLLVNDGDTLQLGIGKIPDAVLRYLCNHKDLGIHTEMFSDGVIELIEQGVINNRKKTFHRGKTITSFCMGTQRLYDFVNNNPHVEFFPSEHVNAPANIAKNENMVSINSAIEVDLSGQVVSDSVGYKLYSGIGGQVDFIRGASMSKGGKPIIALPSTAKGGTVSKIVPFVSEGGGVVTSRGDVHYVVTEYGVASLRGKSIRERALELIRIAHPKFRASLLEQVREHYRVPEYQIQQPLAVTELGDVELKKLDLGGVRCYLRPLSGSDERHLQEFFYSHNKDTLKMRYNYQPTRMSRETSASLVAVDQSKDLALCIVDAKGAGEEILAVGRYYYISTKNEAEVAFVVRENYHSKGMASTLLQWMIVVASKRQLNALIAAVRSDNLAMQKVLMHHGFFIKNADEGGEIIMALNLK